MAWGRRTQAQKGNKRSPQSWLGQGHEPSVTCPRQVYKLAARFARAGGQLNVSVPPSLRDPLSRSMVREGMFTPTQTPEVWPKAAARSLFDGQYVVPQEDFDALTYMDRPKNVDLMDNVRAAESWKSMGMGNPDVPTTELKYLTFRNHVTAGGPWDYKLRDKKFENFGNYNYGLTGAAAGIPSKALLRMAGRAQKQNDVTAQYGVPAGFWDALNGRGGSGAFGDDWKDQYWIKKGLEDYARLKAGRPLSQYPLRWEIDK